LTGSQTVATTWFLAFFGGGPNGDSDGVEVMESPRFLPRSSVDRRSLSSVSNGPRDSSAGEELHVETVDRKA